MNATKKVIATIAVLTATASVALADGHVSNALETAEQELSHAVVVKSVTAAADGWVVIHAIKDGKPVDMVVGLNPKDKYTAAVKSAA